MSSTIRKCPLPSLSVSLGFSEDHVKQLVATSQGQELTFPELVTVIGFEKWKKTWFGVYSRAGEGMFKNITKGEGQIEISTLCDRLKEPAIQKELAGLKHVNAKAIRLVFTEVK